MDVNNINKINSLSSVNRLRENESDHGQDERLTQDKSRDNRVDIDDATLLIITRIINNIVIPNRDLPRGELIDMVSQAFLDIPYQANMLIGSSSKPEVLVADCRGVDCFTLLDYVYALVQSDNVESFINHLIEARYKYGEIEFLQRKHFFTDWHTANPKNAIDITMTLSKSVISVNKTLNLHSAGKEYIVGLGGIEREINYIPGDKVDEKAIKNLQNGDLVGLYTKLDGLDVTHVGIFIRNHSGAYFRNASSQPQNMKVVDTPFAEYFKNKPGMIALRAIP